MRQVERVLVLTDLVDSTKLVSTVGDVRAGALNAAVDRLTRDLLAARDGLEIDKTDGFLLLFTDSKAALGFALDLHDGLRKLSADEGVTLAMRVGVHRGTVGLRENPPDDVARGAKPIEVEGLAKPLAARVMTLAVGHQTLVTDTLEQAVDLADSDSVSWVDHGKWRLKGVEEPVRLLEVGRKGLAPLMPPPDSEKAWKAARGPLARQREAVRKAWAIPALRGVVFLVSTVTLVSGGLYWDQTRLKVHDFGEVHWSPDGLAGALDPIPGEVFWQVTSRGGKTLTVTEMNASGHPVRTGEHEVGDEMFSVDAIFSEFGSEPDWSMIEGRVAGHGRVSASREQIRSTDGALVGIEYRLPTGTLTSQAEIEVIADGLRLRWQTPYGAPGLSPEEGVPVEDLIFDDRGRLIARRFFNVSGLQPVANRQGAMGRTLAWDERGRKTEIAFIGADGKRAENPSGLASVRFKYGDGPRPIEEERLNAAGDLFSHPEHCAKFVIGLDMRCFDSEGQPKADLIPPFASLRCHHWTVVWNGERRTTCFDVDGVLTATQVETFTATGHPAEIRLLDPHGSPFAGSEDWASAAHHYSAMGQLLATPTYRNVDGDLMLRRDPADWGDKHRDHNMTRVWDESGRLSQVTFVGEDGKGTVGPFGWTTLKFTRDAGGRATEAALFDPDGAPTAKQTGEHRQVNVLDDLGRATEVRRYGIDGEPALDAFRAHRDVITWDDMGRVTSMAFFDAEGPVERPQNHLRSDGSAKIAITYTDRGRVGRLDFYEPDGTKSLDNHHRRSATLFDRDASGERSGQRFLDPNDEPVDGREGYHRIQWINGPKHGRESIPLRLEWFKADGDRAPSEHGCFIIENALDDRDEIAAQSCFGADGEPAAFRGTAVANFRLERDERGNVVRAWSEGVDGQLVGDERGVADERNAFDTQNRLTRRELFGIVGERVGFGPKDAAVTDFSWDIAGRIEEMIFRGTDMQIVPSGHVQVDRNEIGLPVEWRYIGPDGALEGRLVIERDNEQNARRVRFVNADDGLVDGPSGWSEIKYSREGDLRTAMYFRTDGSAAQLGGDPQDFGGGPEIVHEMPTYPQPGQEHLLAEFGSYRPAHFPVSDGEPGWSGWRLEMEGNQINANSFLDADGELTVPADPGFATARHEPIEGVHAITRFFDAKDQPMEVCGVARTQKIDGNWTAFDLADREVPIPPECAQPEGQLRAVSR